MSTLRIFAMSAFLGTVAALLFQWYAKAKLVNPTDALLIAIFVLLFEWTGRKTA